MIEIKGNSNYAAKAVKLETKVSHPNADKLQGWRVDGYTIYTDMSYNIGDKCVYFPLECALTANLLSACNLYRDKTLNTDKERAGFFENNNRVKAVKLRGELSEGFLLKIDDFVKVFNIAPKIGESFDTVNGETICWKYLPPQRAVSTKEKSRVGKRIEKAKIVENQFRFHFDTEPLKREIDRIKVGQTLHVTNKTHGTSFISGILLVERKLKWYEKLLKRVGVKIVESEYQDICSSRKVIKRVGNESKSDEGFYKIDIWHEAHKRLVPFLEKGMTVYGEIVGYLPGSSSMIQKDYDYGCEVGTFELYIYRITQTNVDGKVFEFDTYTIERWCNKNGFKMVPFYERITVTEELIGDRLIKYLSDKYLEKDCWMCKNKVPEEGCAIRIEDTNQIFKLKSKNFILKESQDLDNGEIDIESNESSELI